MVDGVWIRMMVFNKGDIHAGHKHNHNHITLLSSGKLKITVEGKTTEHTAPTMVFIHKDNNHELESLEDKTVACCIHAVREKETEDILDGLEMPSILHIQGLTQPEIS